MDEAKNRALTASTSPHKRMESGDSDRRSEQELFVVALGASAGGLEALEKFFDHMPADSGLAFVVVQHLSPDFKSLMNELLARHTKLAIHRVTDGIKIEPNSIYLIPPKKEMIVSDGRLLLTDKDPSQGLSLPIDTFLRSLAHEYGRYAIAVILSGTGSDGSRGVLAVHEAGGFVIVQDEASANFDGMPRSAMDTGVVDAVLPPREIASAILDYVHGGVTDSTRDDEGGSIAPDGVQQIFSALHAAYGIDFSYYKPNTVARRVERRLQLSQTPDLEGYIARLRSDPDELNSLYKDLLIGVTRFFRDEEAYQRLELDVIPQLLNRLNGDDELRLWVCGCATGEEAYSIAILIHEALSARRRPIHAKIFATDVHAASLEHASTGIYSEPSLTGISTERLKRYFNKHAAGYQVVPELRKLIVFAPHNVVKDAPFTKLDLISCRNMLIYLQPHAQKKALSLFHFALKTSGFLWLGPSESPGDLSDEFDAIDRHWKIFRKRRDVRLPADFRLPMSPGLGRWRASAGVPAAVDSRALPDIQLLRAYDVLLDEYVPPSLMVNERRELVHSFAGAGKFLSVRDGRPSSDILDLVEPDLKLALAGALQRAAKEKKPIVYGSVSLRSLPADEQLRLAVKPVTIQSTGENYFLVSFESQAKKPAPQLTETRIDFDSASRDRLADVEEELQYTKENLQATIEEMETTNEELQATNEELVASNEELQSTNEELHSVNEELYTVNAEHQRKITELTELTDDMDNLLRSTEIGTIFLDRALRIRKFTPQIFHAFHILPQDVGRNIDTFSHNILHEHLLEEVQRVAKTEKPFEKDVQDRHGRWFLLRIMPYRSKGHADGVVITLVDIASVKKTEADLRRMSKVFMDGADPIIIEDLEGKIVDLNDEAARAYGWSREEMAGQSFSKLVPAEYANEAKALREKCRSGEHVRNVELARKDRQGKVVPILLTLSALSDESGKIVGIASLSKDIEMQKDAERQAREAVIRRDEFLAMLSHELRNPLGAVLNAAELVSRDQACDPDTREEFGVVLRQARQMARLLDDLLDVSRVTKGKIEIRKQVVNLTQLVRDAVEAVQPEIEDRRHELNLQLSGEPLYVEGDPSRLLQIQENLLNNATKYTPPGGRIEIKLEREGDEAVLTVADNGDGIEPEMLSAIFELFVQGPKSLARTDGGMGIGLSLARVLVELHGGKLIANSEGKGQGSTFTLRLPLTQKKPAAVKPPTLPSVKGSRVLVIEDNDDSRVTLQKILTLFGCTVSVASDGRSGFEAICKERPDVALVDIGLPGMDGYEIAHKVRSTIDGHNIRLIAVTGYGRAEDRSAVTAAGFDAHVVKPINPDELIRILRG